MNYVLVLFLLTGSLGGVLQHSSSTSPLETQHASLKRKKEVAPPPPLYSPILEKSEVNIYFTM